MKLQAKQTLALTLVAGSAFLAGCGKGMDAGNSTYVGTVVGLTKEHGALCPTNEGELALQNIRGGASGGSTHHFTVFDPKVWEQLEKAQIDRSVVELSLNKRQLSGPCTMEADSFVTGVKEFNIEASGVNPKAAITHSAGEDVQLPSGQAVTLQCLPGANNTFSCAVK